MFHHRCFRVQRFQLWTLVQQERTRNMLILCDCLLFWDTSTTFLYLLTPHVLFVFCMLDYFRTSLIALMNVSHSNLELRSQVLRKSDTQGLAELSQLRRDAPIGCNYDFKASLMEPSSRICLADNWSEFTSARHPRWWVFNDAAAQLFICSDEIICFLQQQLNRPFSVSLLLFHVHAVIYWFQRPEASRSCSQDVVGSDWLQIRQEAAHPST